jgi:glucokinase
MSFYLGLDIGGTKSAGLVGDADGAIVARVAAPTLPGPWRDAVDAQIGLIHAACGQAGVDAKNAAALGVSCGGPTDHAAGVIHNPPALPNWVEVPIRDVLADAFHVPVAIENDANATALAEHRWGAGRGCRHLAFVTMSTGIGAGLILDDRLYRGKAELAGEIGHAVVQPGGVACECGKRGCLEALASGTAIGRMGRERYRDESVDAREVVRRARTGDTTAISILREAGSWMGIGLANLLQTLNLERILLGTLAIVAGDLLLPPIREAVRENVWPNIAAGVEILPANADSADRAALAVAVAPVA